MANHAPSPTPSATSTPRKASTIRFPPRPSPSPSPWPTNWTSSPASSRIGEKPTGSGDPYALRRAALGVIRIIRDNNLRLKLTRLLTEAGGPASEILDFLADRLRVQLRAEGARHDVLSAVFAAGADDDIVRLLARTDAVTRFLASDDGANLLTAYRRAANILRIEERKDGPHNEPPDPALLQQPEELALANALHALTETDALLTREDYPAAMALMARLRTPLDAFFDRVTVNAPEPDLRRNRLNLLSRVRAAMDRVADFSKIEG